MRSLKLVAQGLAVGLVAALLGLLVWKVATQSRSSAIPKQIARGARPRAPLFTLSRLDGGGGKISLAALRGKVVVLNFWASWCGPCKDEAPALASAWTRWKDKGVVVLGIDWHDFAGDGRRFARRHGVTYPLARDGNGQVLADYGVDGVPQTFFVDRRGRLVGRHYEGPVDARGLDENIRTALAS